VVLRQRTSLILTGVLLVITLGGGILAAHAAVGALRSFQRESVLTKEGDVQTISSWMTIPYIARVYGVPERYLYQSLQVPEKHPLPHSTLHALASYNRRPVDSIIHNVQSAIINYRRAHPGARPNQKRGKSPVPGRKAF
jgi:hypothetical protein